jgi:hypothetical protein
LGASAERNSSLNAHTAKRKEHHLFGVGRGEVSRPGRDLGQGRRVLVPVHYSCRSSASHLLFSCTTLIRFLPCSHTRLGHPLAIENRYGLGEGAVFDTPTTVLQAKGKRKGWGAEREGNKVTFEIYSKHALFFCTCLIITIIITSLKICSFLISSFKNVKFNYFRRQQ